MNYLLPIAFFLSFCHSQILSQNTVGLISFDNDESIGGYNLIYPENQSTVFLLNECGELVHQWEDNPLNRPGKTAYLSPEGNLLRSKFDIDKMTAPSFGTGGGGGVVELLTWDNEPLWCYVLADSLNRQHHDVHLMENGNVLLIAWERIGFEEMLENGFDSSANIQVEYWPDYIRELNPVTNDTIWEWHVWDHLIQDYDSTKTNFGVVSDHPELVDINYNEYSAGRQDWLHSNAIDYDPVKDQIILSVRNFQEIWIIDHSTTTDEAAGHTGGNSGMGGDLLFRWGNPEAYKQGDSGDRKLFYQHDAQWIDDFVDPGYEFNGGIVLYNNFITNGLSLGQILEPVWDDSSQNYTLVDSTFLPAEFSKTISHPDTASNYSTAASSIQIMGDGHVIMCAGRQGFSFELTPEGTVAWEYITPLKQGQPVEQGTLLSLSENFTFQLERYPENFSGFFGKDLSPQGYIELNPNETFCSFTDVVEPKRNNSLFVYPNPATRNVIIENKQNSPFDVMVYNYLGQVVYEVENIIHRQEVDVSGWGNGIYFIKNKNSEEIVRVMVLN